MQLMRVIYERNMIHFSIEKKNEFCQIFFKNFPFTELNVPFYYLDTSMLCYRFFTYVHV